MKKYRSLFNKKLLLPIVVLVLLLAVTTGIVLYGEGYRFNLQNGKPKISGTGLLVANSTPNGAQVFINGHLTTATDDTINLAPGEYTIRIVLEGYFPWEKKLKVQEEIVTLAEALLFPTAPKLESITSSGVVDPILDPSASRIAYLVASQSARKNGIYALDMGARPILTLQSSSTQIADDTLDIFSKSKLSWSPDGKNLIASVSANFGLATTYLLTSNAFNDTPQDVTATLRTFENTWNAEKIEKETVRFQALKKPVRDLINTHFKIIAWSPDETRILYTASASADLPLIIKPRRIGTESIPEDRSIKEGSIYVYDIKEDTNYKINVEVPSSSVNENHESQTNVLTTKSPFPLQWFPDSNHLIYVNDKKISILEYDGSNMTTVYAGPFIDNYVYPWPNGSKIVILTNFAEVTSQPNLYTIGLR